MTTGIIIACILLLLLCNIFGKKIKKPQIRKTLGRVHKILGIIFLIAIFVHLTLTFPLIKQRPLPMYILGFIMLFAALTAIITFCCHKKYPKGWLRLHKIVAGILFVCVIAHVAIGIYSLKDYQNKVSTINVQNADLTLVKDGTYTGNCDTGYVYAKVKVQVKDSAITSVEILEHRTERGQKAEQIPEKIVDEQKITVDTVSGATNSSKVIEQAVYNALMASN